MTLVDKMQNLVENIDVKENKEETKEIELKENMVIQCQTQQELLTLLNYCQAKNMTWLGGQKPLEFAPWENRKDLTCIAVKDNNRIGVGTLKTFEDTKEECEWEIIKFKDLGIELIEEITYNLKFYDDEVYDKELADEEREFFNEQINLMKEKYGDENVNYMDDNWCQVTILLSMVKKFERRIELLDNALEELEFIWDIKEEVV